MKKLVLMVVALAWLMTSCGTKQAQMQNVRPFEHVFIFGNKHTDVFITQNKEGHQVGITGNRENVHMYMRHDTLYVEDLALSKKSHYAIYLAAPHYSSICVSDVDRFASTDTIRQDTISLSSMLTKRVEMALDVQKLSTVRGLDARKAVLKGRADTANINTRYTDKMTLDALDLQVKNMHLTAFFTFAELNVAEQLWLDEALESNIIYVGTPEVMNCKMRFSNMKNPMVYTWRNQLFERL